MSNFEKDSHNAVILFAIAFICMVTNFESSAQCKTLFSYSLVEEAMVTDRSEVRGFSISLKLEEGPQDNYTIELFDLYIGELAEKKNFSFKTGELKKVFLGVKPSRYLIYIQNGSCKKQSITSGVEGIEIK